MTITVVNGCSGKEKHSPEAESDSIDALLKDAYSAIKAGDWNAYSGLTITSADFILKAMGISKFKEKQSYVGSSVKPGEIKRQVEQFRRASKGDDEDSILFEKDSFVSKGKQMLTGFHKTLNNVSIPYQMFSFKVKSESGEVMEDLYPRVVVVKWGDYHRIMGLVFSQSEKKKSQ